jgi:hypothetical protein
LQATNPNFWTIAYINCSAAVKALCDVICTSGNAEKIVNAAPKDKDLLFVPDENLGQWVMEQTGRPMTLWKGNCYAHVEFQREQVLAAKRQFPDAKVVVHPESLREVRDLADAVCSTEKMISYCKNDPAKRFVIVTESGIIHRMQKECPGKEFLCAPVFDVMRAPTDNCRCSECKFMKLNTLEKVRDCMKNLAPRIELPEEILKRARLPIERMLEISAITEPWFCHRIVTIPPHGCNGVGFILPLHFETTTMKKLKKQNHTKVALFAGAAALMALTPNTHAQSSVDALLNKLEQKGILTVDEAKELKAENQQDSAADFNKAHELQVPDAGLDNELQTVRRFPRTV